MRRAQQIPADDDVERGGKKRRKSGAPSSTGNPPQLQPLVPAAPSAVTVTIQPAPNLLSSSTIVTLNGEMLVTATKLLAARDPDIASIFASFGPPPLWERAPGF